MNNWLNTSNRGLCSQLPFSEKFGLRSWLVLLRNVYFIGCYLVSSKIYWPFAGTVIA